MKVCMIVPERSVKGGIASVVNGYREQGFPEEIHMTYIESYRDGSKLQKLIKALKGYWAFWHLLLTDKPDLVHIHSSFGPSFYRKMPFIYLASWRRIPIINHIHGAEFDAFYEQAENSKKRRVRKVYGKCSLLIALSDEWKEKLSTVVPEEKITVIENYCQIPEEITMDRKPQLLFLGEIGKRKGCFDIPEILFLVQQKYQEIPGMVMAGEGEVSKVKVLLQEKGLLKKVSFPGWVRGEEKEKLLRESSILLFPSYHEGMPMTVLEAMAYGMAVVTTDVGGIPVLIEDGVTGYLCKPGDTERFAQCLCELLEKEELRRSTGEAARRQVSEQYSFSMHRDKLLKLYRQTIDGKHPQAAGGRHAAHNR